MQISTKKNPINHEI